VIELLVVLCALAMAYNLAKVALSLIGLLACRVVQLICAAGLLAQRLTAPGVPLPANVIPFPRGKKASNGW
jgi:hypothetical protein